MQATTNGTLADTEVKFSDKSACCVIMASFGYPEKYDSGFEIDIDSSVEDSVYVAGAKLDENGNLLTAGGRVLGVTAVDLTLEKAIRAAYDKVTKVGFANAYYRTDIGAKALKALK